MILDAIVMVVVGNPRWLMVVLVLCNVLIYVSFEIIRMASAREIHIIMRTARNRRLKQELCLNAHKRRTYYMLTAAALLSLAAISTCLSACGFVCVYAKKGLRWPQERGEKRKTRRLPKRT